MSSNLEGLLEAHVDLQPFKIFKLLLSECVWTQASESQIAASLGKRSPSSTSSESLPKRPRVDDCKANKQVEDGERLRDMACGSELVLRFCVWHDFWHQNWQGTGGTKMAAAKSLPSKPSGSTSPTSEAKVVQNNIFDVILWIFSSMTIVLN